MRGPARRRGVLVLLVAVLALGACASTRSLDTTDVASQVEAALAQQVGGEFAVTCPTAVPAEAGAAFTCTATDERSGDEVAVQVVQEDDRGSFRWSIASPGVPDS